MVIFFNMNSNSPVMDTLDIAIIRTMGIQPYGHHSRGPESLNPRYLAKVLRVSPETIRNRVTRMEQTGVISTYAIFPNLRYFGMEAVCYLLRTHDESEPRDFEDRVSPVEGMLLI